ncbi:hypothetical protein LCGC14_0587730 [marine sediment metagenome]|uniref:Uncharacterized protein n=1 Tax=marine sediment metagenome TaxID=412755 RepID=A0A0F9REH5_9ZZZZ
MKKTSPCQGCGVQVEFRAYPKPYCLKCRKEKRESLEARCSICGAKSEGFYCDFHLAELRQKGGKSFEEIAKRNKSHEFRRSRTTSDKVHLDG